MNERPTYAELSAYLYLTAPLVAFQLSFLKPWYGIPGAFLIIGNFAIMCRNAARDAFAPPRWAVGFSLIIVAAWMVLGGYGLVFPTNSDWIKHYAIINELVSNHWPVIDDGETLRYALGWYIVPALLMKTFGGDANLYLSIWTLIGMAIFMRLALGLFKSEAYWMALPVVFILFSGADILGTWATHFQFGPLYHLEWWSGWGEYPASTISIFWTPQHALPAWIGIALLMRQRDIPSMLASLGILFFAVCFWSPFAAIGLLPFALLLLYRYGVFGLLSGRTLAALVLIGFPIGLYLTADTGEVPKYLAMFGQCGRAPELCFSMSTYAFFALVEFVPVAAVLLLAKSEHRGALITAIIMLFAYPLVHFGIANDLMMRASIPALAVLAILSANVISTRGPAIVMPLVLILLVGLPTSGGEIARAILTTQGFPETTTIYQATMGKAGLRAQYFAHYVGVTRSPDPARTASR